MEKRPILAIGICIGIFIVWFLLIEPRINPKPPPRPPTPPPAKKEPKPPPAPPPGPAPAPAVKVEEYPDQGPVTFETPHYVAVLTQNGAGIERLSLRYPGPGDRVDLLPAQRTPHFAVRLADGSVPIDTKPWKLVEKKGQAIEYSYLLPSGVELRKTFTLDSAKKHSIEMALWLQSKAAEEGKPAPERALRLEILALNGLHHDTAYKYEQYFQAVVLGEDLKRWTLPDVQKGEAKLAEATRIPDDKARAEAVRSVEDDYLFWTKPAKDWIGLKNRFFAAVFDPDPDASQRLEGFGFRLAPPLAREKTVAAVVRLQEIHVGGQPVVLKFGGFFGPVQEEALKELPKGDKLAGYAGGCGLGPVVNIVAPFILWLLNVFGDKVFGNYGVAIVFTTLIIRLILFPLSRKSQVSAFRMQQLGPKIQILRERYKDDQQKFGVEQMRLFREHKINPLSGCLPLLLQLPIFIGMFTVFDMSIELRKEPFMLWIRDLSHPDALVSFGREIDIPLVPVFDAFNLLPIVMTITWFLQAYFAPRSPDPQMQTQQKMMMAMPIVFGVICYSYASGLSLYFLVNSLLAMAEQKLIKKFFLKPAGGVSPP